MLELWRQSEQESGKTRPNVRVVSKADFLALSEQERGELLGDFIIIKDTNALSEFFPRLASIFEHCIMRLTHAL